MIRHHLHYRVKSLQVQVVKAPIQRPFSHKGERLASQEEVES